MALEPGQGPRLASPASSGRSSPIASRFRSEDEPFKKDKSFRRYASGVERALSLFDTALQEWADYISFLGRLLKALQQHPPEIRVIPYKTVVSRRLAQCLAPSLPSGVHQKALEVYAYIFKVINKDALSRDLVLYLPGLSPTLSFASLSVRPAFLSLVEDHILKLESSSIRPALKALILALLPGLEEEASEDFERVLRTLETLKAVISGAEKDAPDFENSAADAFFWQCFFLATITGASRRQGALAFLSRKLPKLEAPPLDRHAKASDGFDGNKASEPRSSSNVQAILKPEPGLLIRCFVAGLSDGQILIQRGFLDLLVTHLPLHSSVLQHQVSADDLEHLIISAVGVVSRRDMSLNRRLWAWLLGPEPSQSADSQSIAGSPVAEKNALGDSSGFSAAGQSEYFGRFGLATLVRGLHKMIDHSSDSPSETARPFRISLSLMDRWEIGGVVVPEIFLSVVSSVRRFERTTTSREQFNEVLRSASVFFDGVESGLIWGELFQLTTSALGHEDYPYEGRLDKMDLVTFIVKHFNVREEEMLLVHMPLVTVSILMRLRESSWNTSSDSHSTQGQTAHISKLALDIAESLLSLIPSRAFLLQSSGTQNPASDKADSSGPTHGNETLKDIDSFYSASQGNLDISQPPLSPHEIGRLLLRESAAFVVQSLQSPLLEAQLGLTTKLLFTLLKKIDFPDFPEMVDVVNALEQRLSTAPNTNGKQISFQSISAIVHLVCLLSSHSTISLKGNGIQGLFPSLVRQLWKHLSPSCPKYHVEATRCLWQLQSSAEFDFHAIEASICSIMVGPPGTSATEKSYHGRTFSVLWTHSISAQHSGQDATSKHPQGYANSGKRNVDIDIMLGRPLFLMLDALENDSTELSAFVRGWLQNLPSIERIFLLLVRKLLAADFLSLPPNDSRAEPRAPGFYGTEASVDWDNLTYHLQTLSNILKWSTEETWSLLAKYVLEEPELDLVLSVSASNDGGVPLQTFFVSLCMKVLETSSMVDEHSQSQLRIPRLCRVGLLVLNQILLSPFSNDLQDLRLEDLLINHLINSLEQPDPFIQVSLLDATYAALRMRPSTKIESPNQQYRRTSKDNARGSRLSLSIDHTDKDRSLQVTALPPPHLVKALQAGLGSWHSRAVLDSWIKFLAECLPLFSNSIFQVLIPLVECLCTQINATFESLKATFKDDSSVKDDSGPVSESSLIALLTGIEQVLASAHDVLLADESNKTSIKSPEQPQGFFGNMVSGVFTSDTPYSRNASANDRLTVLLSFKDTVRICFAIWAWEGYGSSGVSQDSSSLASFSYTSLRMRNRARRILERLFSVESLECLETLVEIWHSPATIAPRNESLTASVFSLLHVLDGSRPQNTIPAIFDAIYSRTNPTALDHSRKSSLASDLVEVDVATFLVEYAQSLEDDAMDEIWIDCMNFLRDVLANPFPQRQILPQLLEFLAILGEKVDNTNFGEQRKMRRELGDVFLRLLGATFTTKPQNQPLEPTKRASEDVSHKADHQDEALARREPHKPQDFLALLTRIVPNIPKIILESDRVLGAATTISTNMIGPAIRSKNFPETVTQNTLDLLYQLSRIPNSQKSWRKDIADAFNDSRFFSSNLYLVKTNWLGLVRQWTLTDKDRMPELLSRLTAPTTAGIMFGVGASSARLEADRKTQLNLRRIAFLVLAAAEDSFAAILASIEGKLVELLSATAATSPSSATRSDVYMVVRALVLKTSAIHLAPLWPIVNSELQAAITSVFPDVPSTVYSNYSILQACKLLDMLIVLLPDEFQLHEWLFVTDTIDAVYRPAEWKATALVDEVSEELRTAGSPVGGQMSSNESSKHTALRRPLLGADSGHNVAGDELLHKVLKPFFNQLSIYAFESTYSMGTPDWQACFDGLLADIFNESSIVGS
ncbi:MAG: hypothetical protein M4579_001448 [Chaenotheca gracillima]|nr:MAG: hypothetical protein M4579_001448 [Chaenotheca gracillima]